jgi:hypothetical protein
MALVVYLWLLAVGLCVLSCGIFLNHKGHKDLRIRIELFIAYYLICLLLTIPQSFRNPEFLKFYANIFLFGEETHGFPSPFSSYS